MLSVDQFSFKRAQEVVLASTRFELHQGELMFVIGGNGSGKTTLIRMLAGLLPAPPEATMQWHGEPFRSGDAHAGPATLYLGHHLAIKDDLTCLENLRFYARFLPQRQQTSLASALQSVGLDGYQTALARQMSAGQRKRLALARLRVCAAELWLLDEPYSNLDANGTVLVDRMLSRHLGEGGMAVVTSHGGYVPALDGLRQLQLESA